MTCEKQVNVKQADKNKFTLVLCGLNPVTDFNNYRQALNNDENH